MFCKQKNNSTQISKLNKNNSLNEHDKFYDIRRIDTVLFNKLNNNRIYQYTNPSNYLTTYDAIKNKKFDFFYINQELDRMNNDLIKQYQELFDINLDLMNKSVVLRNSNDLLKRKIDELEKNSTASGFYIGHENNEQNTDFYDKELNLGNFNIKDSKISEINHKINDKSNTLIDVGKVDSNKINSIEENLKKVFTSTDETSAKSFDDTKRKINDNNNEEKKLIETLAENKKKFDDNTKKTINENNNEEKKLNIGIKDELLKLKMDEKYARRNGNLEINKNINRKNLNFPLTNNVTNIINRIQ